MDELQRLIRWTKDNPIERYRENVESLALYGGDMFSSCDENGNNIGNLLCTESIIRGKKPEEFI